MLAGEIVGPTGEIIGIDKAEAAVHRASARAASRQLSNIRFVQADLLDFCAPEGLDAIIGPLVLMYFPDPAAVLKHLTRLLRPGGLVSLAERLRNEFIENKGPLVIPEFFGAWSRTERDTVNLLLTI